MKLFLLSLHNSVNRIIMYSSLCHLSIKYRKMWTLIVSWIVNHSFQLLVQDPSLAYFVVRQSIKLPYSHFQIRCRLLPVCDRCTASHLGPYDRSNRRRWFTTENYKISEVHIASKSHSPSYKDAWQRNRVQQRRNVSSACRRNQRFHHRLQRT